MTIVYHIKIPGQTLDEGYIGVTEYPEKRKQQHFSSLDRGFHPNKILQENFNEYYQFYILIESSEDYCYNLEKLLRPRSYMGLNIAPGGSGRNFSELSIIRSREFTLPAQISSKDGTHHWFRKEHSIRIAEKNTELFTNTVSVTCKNGITFRIPKDEFEKQKIGNRVNWEYVGVASKEGTKRRNDNKQECRANI